MSLSGPGWHAMGSWGNRGDPWALSEDTCEEKSAAELSEQVLCRETSPCHGALLRPQILG